MTDDDGHYEGRRGRTEKKALTTVRPARTEWRHYRRVGAGLVAGQGSPSADCRRRLEPGLHCAFTMQLLSFNVNEPEEPACVRLQG